MSSVSPLMDVTQNVPKLHPRLPQVDQLCTMPEHHDLLEGLLAALQNNAVYDVLNASEMNHRNAWYQAFFEFYERIVGPARDYEMPLGKKRIKNFKSKVVDEIWPLLESIAKNKSNEIIRDDTYTPDKYDEIPLDKYLKAAIEQYVTYNAIKASHEESVLLAKEAKAALKTGMLEAEEEYNAFPPGVEGRTPHHSSLTLHSAPHSVGDNDEDNDNQDNDEEDEEDDDDDDYVAPYAARKPSDSSFSYHTKKPIKRCTKRPKPPAAGDANLSKSPFEDLDHYQDRILLSMKRMKEELFSDVGDDMEEKKREKRLKMLYVSEDHHRRMGDVQRADEIKAEINVIEKDVLGI